MSLMLMIAIAAAADPAPPPMPSFLAGCWEQKRGAEWSQECWTEPRAGQMMGSGRSGSGDRLTSWEFMRIERGSDGGLTFYGSPSGAPGHPFKMQSATASSIEFVDPGHDYPQRIAYQRTGEGLTAEISLKDGSKPIRWSYVRSSSSGD